MKKLIRSEKPVTAEPDLVSLSRSLGRWMGRRDAFGLVAGRCAAADAEALRRIREDKIYKQFQRTWAEFCTHDLHVARRSVDREIGYLEEFGPAYFHVRQMTHITAPEYRSIAAHFTQENVIVDGTAVALLPEHSEKVAAAVAGLLKQIEPKQPKPVGVPFDALVKRCRSVAEMLAELPEALDPQQQIALADAIAGLRAAAAGLGVLVFDRR